jgi:hypothetical protein
MNIFKMWQINIFQKDTKISKSHFRGNKQQIQMRNACATIHSRIFSLPVYYQKL